MFKLVRQQNTIKQALRCTQRQVARSYSKSRLHQNERVGFRKMATSSGEGTNDAVLVTAGMGILGATCYLV